MHAAKGASSSAGKDNQGGEIESKGERKREREREKTSSVKRRDYRKLVANAKTCTILQCQAHKAATCPTKTEINHDLRLDGADDCELGLHPDPGHHDRVGLVPFGSETAGQAFLVSHVLPVGNGIRRANKGGGWGERAPQVLAGLSILLPLGFSGFSSDGVPR